MGRGSGSKLLEAVRSRPFDQRWRLTLVCFIGGGRGGYSLYVVAVFFFFRVYFPSTAFFSGFIFRLLLLLFLVSTRAWVGVILDGVDSLVTAVCAPGVA